MTRDDVIRMAREAELEAAFIGLATLERFAALVAAAEREACAKECELQDEYDRDDSSSAYVMKTHCIEAILARGNK